MNILHTQSRLATAFALVLGGLASGCATDAAGTTPGFDAAPGLDAATESPNDPGPHALKTVFLVLLENEDATAVIGSPSAPYLNGTLLPQAARADAYSNPPGGHPSEVDYLWLEAGLKLVHSDADPATNHQSTTAHLARQLDDAGISWRSYQEDITGTVCPLHSSGLYAAKHNAFVFFDDETGGGDPQDAGCIAHNRPYAELAGDLAGDRTARYNFITPNLCHDGHNLCAPQHDRVRQADDWLSTEIPALMASNAYADGGALFITWDEAKHGENAIGMVLLSPLGKGGGYHNSIAYDHSSMLRTLQRIFGVGPYLGGAASADDLSDLFTTFP